jgi:NADH dehydrogenase [ubiquinone] 1 alpha subcomplex assembly factor 7
MTLATTLAERIRRDGPITVADYMSAVSDAYYARGDVFGASGDFITAPDISQAFGEIIGLWCAVVWQAMGSPKIFRLVECGPGRGTLMADLLRAGNILPGFSAAADLHLLERSDALKAKQAAALRGRAATWHADIACVPPGPMILVANEFLDALPIRQFEKTDAGWTERHVTVDANGGFAFALKPGAQAPLPSQLATTAQTGAIFETSPDTSAFITAIAGRIAAQGGAALLIDYGHKTSAFGDTLQAVKNHKYCGVFETPGEADLTAHVDFEAVSKAAWKSGAKVFGPLEQGTWLSNAGIRVRGVRLSTDKPPDVAQGIEAGIRRLTAPDAMGALFKVLAVAHPALVRLDGFQQDAVL